MNTAGDHEGSWLGATRSLTYCHDNPIASLPHRERIAPIAWRLAGGTDQSVGSRRKKTCSHDGKGMFSRRTPRHRRNTVMFRDVVLPRYCMSVISAHGAPPTWFPPLCGRIASTQHGKV